MRAALHRLAHLTGLNVCRLELGGVRCSCGRFYRWTRAGI